MVPQGDSFAILEDEARSLCIEAAAGDRLAFGKLMRLWQTRLWQVARRYTGDAGEAEDIVQTVFVAFWQRLTDIGPPLAVGPFLHRATLNTCRDWSRRRSVRAFFFKASSLEGREDVSDVAIDGEHDAQTLVTLDRLIAHLPRGLKEPLILCAIDGVSHKEAGAILGLSSKAIETRIARAKKLLLKLWPDQSSE